MLHERNQRKPFLSCFFSSFLISDLLLNYKSVFIMTTLNLHEHIPFMLYVWWETSPGLCYLSINICICIYTFCSFFLWQITFTCMHLELLYGFKINVFITLLYNIGIGIAGKYILIHTLVLCKSVVPYYKCSCFMNCFFTVSRIDTLLIYLPHAIPDETRWRVTQNNAAKGRDFIW